MSLTSDGKRMLDWAQKNNSLEECRAVFAPIDKSITSYYEKRKEQESLLYEYDIEEFPQVKACLEELWQEESVMKEMILISSVSAMKHKPDEKKEETGLEEAASAVSDEEFEIPEYVYIF